MRTSSKPSDSTRGQRAEKLSASLGLSLPVLRDRLKRHMADKQADARQKHPSCLTDLRAEILDHVVGRAAHRPAAVAL
jgi:hypothetical protein